ncbi:MAG: hypothetical protein HOB79_11685 [Rhodospirillaceae bacterium]|jgi:hypothetical protein|nr:hypothetical protein [Rhodospirillaceae bacterium]MBT7768726.1 hypothetical protein [Rhodospirillales bacterium]MBT4701719.1 hypothetical protein [Rhodospirillaceae bacterium]MBT5034778.1 hypothetical protein [Rhodospirillaceae bacterium]MBT6218341.1 hypothetical protein [Rhodospirillaceae bacterium]
MAEEHIKINDINPRVQFAADGIAVEFEFLFPAFDLSEVEVYLGDTLQVTDLAVELNIPPAVGGTVTFDAPPAAATVVTIVRNLPIIRTTDFQESGEFRSKVINDELDYLTACLQQVNNITGRSITLNTTDPDGSLNLPTKDVRASKALIFDGTGDIAVSNDNYNDQATAAAADAASATASAAAAAISETNAATSETNAGVSETNAAASATAAATAATSNLFNTITNKSDADSPIAPDLGDDGTVFVIDTTSGNVVINMPSIDTVGEGYRIGIVKNGAANTITVNRDGTDTINGLTALTITEDTEQFTLVADDNSPDNWVGFGGSAIISAGSIVTAMLADDVVTTAKIAAGAVALAEMSNDAKRQVIAIAVGDEVTPIVIGTGAVTFRTPYAFTLTDVRASLTTAQASGSILTVDINEGGTTVLSTKITLDNTEKTSTTAATAPVISDSALADDAEITVDIDQVGDGTAAGLKIYLIGYQA